MLIEKLKEYIENNNIEIRSKLIKEINVEFEENELLVKSFFEPEFKEELNNELEYVSRYLKTLQYADIDEIKKTIKDAFSNKEFKYLIKEIENAIEFLRQNNNNDINREYIYKLIKINNIIEPLEKYVKSQIVVVNGDGGTGKTHLLTKIANDMLDNDIPTIIFYGQNMYDIEKYINYIEQNMKINNLFEDISKQATQKNQTGIVIFDAINETRQVQIDVINYLLKNIFGKNIKLVISYRNGDIKANIKNLLDKYPQITLYGFSDVIEAAVKFSEYYNIDIGEILETNFANNPLILKIFCEAYNEKAEEKGQRGFVAATYFFERYFINISQKIIDELSIKGNNRVINGKEFWNYIGKEIAQKMIEEKRTYLIENELEMIINNLKLNVAACKVIEKFIIHKLLENNRIYLGYKKFIIGYKFTFQRLSDFLITRYLLNQKNKNETWEDFFKKKENIDFYKENRTLIENLVEHVPIRTGKELFDIYDENTFFDFNSIYIRGLRYRSSKSFDINVTKSTQKILNYMKNTNLEDYQYEEWLITLSSSLLVSYHALNVNNYLFDFLLNMDKNTLRDIWLNEFLKIDVIRTRIKSLLKVPYYAELNKFSLELKSNLSKLFFLLLSVSNREIRDKATKALTLLIVSDVTLADELIDAISKVDDQYIIERFLVSLYSAHILNENSLLEKHYISLENLYKNKSISNLRIRHYLLQLNQLCYDRGIITYKKDFHNICKKARLNSNYVSKKEYEKLLNKTGEYNNVRFSLSSMGDFHRYQIYPQIKCFEFVDKEIEKKYRDDKKEFLTNLNEEEKKLYKKMMVEFEKEKKEIENDVFDIDELIYLKRNYYGSMYEEEFENLIGEERKEILRDINSDIYSCEEKSFPEKVYTTIILNKMFKLGYNTEIEKYDGKCRIYDRHEHRSERIGKKYQWIALYELLGECLMNLKLKKDENYYRILDIDIDALQIKDNEKEVYEFYDLYCNEIKEINIDWENRNFNKVYDNIDIIENLKQIKYKNNIYIPIHISQRINYKIDCKMCYYRLNTFFNIGIDIKKIKKEQLNSLSMSSGTIYHNYNLYDLNNGIECDYFDTDIVNLWKECYLENEYDYSNLGITKDGKNRTYMILAEYITNKFGLKYDYKGIYYDKIGIVSIQNPFDAESSYLYLRKDIYEELLNDKDLIIGVYSEKEYENNNENAFSKYSICCAIDAAYKYSNGCFEKIAIYKRKEDIIV